jgi:hypothetical protein
MDARTITQIAIDDADGRLGDAGEDDSAIVASRAWHKPLDLHGVGSSLAVLNCKPAVADIRQA